MISRALKAKKARGRLRLSRHVRPLERARSRGARAPEPGRRRIGLARELLKPHQSRRLLCRRRRCRRKLNCARAAREKLRRRLAVLLLLME